MKNQRTLTHRTSRTRARILSALADETGGKTVAEIAEELAIHPNTVRFHLEDLVENGQAEPSPSVPSGRGRPATRFRALAAMDPTGPRNYRALAEVLIQSFAELPDPRQRSLMAGRDWGERLVAIQQAAVTADPVTRLIQILDDVGFAPEPGGELEINLRHCPFLDLSTAAQNLVCSVHLGLMQGALDTLGSDLVVADLRPFAQPDRCVTHLARKEPVG